MKAWSITGKSSLRFANQLWAWVRAAPMRSASFFELSSVSCHARRAASSPVFQARNSRSAAIQLRSLFQRRKIASCATSA